MNILANFLILKFITIGVAVVIIIDCSRQASEAIKYSDLLCDMLLFSAGTRKITLPDHNTYYLMTFEELYKLGITEEEFERVCKFRSRIGDD